MAYTKSSKEYYERNKDILNEKSKAKYHKNAKQICETRRLKSTVRYSRYERNAKNRNISFNISFEQFTKLWENRPNTCPVFNIPLSSPSLDRIDNTKGYDVDNIQCISARANFLKRDGTALDHLQIAIHAFNLTEQQIRDMVEIEIQRLNNTNEQKMNLG